MRMKNAPSRLILLDYDGTLLPLKRRIDRSFLPTALRRLLSRLSRRHRVIMVTGRDLRDLRRLAGPLKGVGKVGTHGIEATGVPGLRLSLPAKRRRFINDRRRLAAALKREFAREKGVFLQVKRYALSLHFSHQERNEAAFQARFRRVVRRLGTPGLWEFQAGKHMIDLRPHGFSKGQAVRTLLRLYPNHRPLYAGDDRSDLPAFRVLGRKGLRVGVGRVVPRKACDLWFPTPKSFVSWLERLI